ncbi:uncharacterized protein LOC134222282 [Armigeres subalbatus]|uniref:uncharacterized protein LOC134222282 n=1 Tax=Armigeres subalbatus TaxID=124917 RepID=UPI002ED09AC6
MTPEACLQCVDLDEITTADEHLLWQSARDSKCDVAIISDPYRIPPGNGNWVADEAGTAAICTVGRYPYQEIVYRAAEGFVIAKVNGIYICSCYAPPRWTIDQFNRMLDKVAEELIDRRPVVIAGDFNAWAVEWGSRCTNPRGWSLLEAFARLNVDLINEGSTSTYRRDGRESIIDVTFCSPALARNTNWRVCEDYTHSDHQAVLYCVGGRVHSEPRESSIKERKWKTESFDKDVFAEAMRFERNLQNLSPDELVAALTRACDATMPRKVQPRYARRQIYWWNETIAELRRSCFRARRRMQRARSDVEREDRRPVFRAAKAALKKEIRLSKAACMNELCHNANANPWGDAYRVAMAKIKGPAIPLERSPEKLKAIIEGLFPYHEAPVWPPTPYGEANTSRDEARVTNLELVTAAKSLKLIRLRD